MEGYCSMCGKPAECKHHLIFGYGLRSLADQDRCYLMMCNECHNMASDITRRIHGNPMAEKLSKMLGQALWERDEMASAYGEDIREARIMLTREDFRKRYGKSFL